MNSKKIILFSALLVALFSLSSFNTYLIVNATETIVAQDGLVVYATFDGKEDYGYNFITKDRDGEEHMLTFQKVNESVLNTFNLNDDSFVGVKFKITFNREIKISKDENDMEDEDEINTITKLEKL
jgi:secreted PhoX family phosphatase